MSSYVGNNERCRYCKITYKQFKTGMSYREVWLMYYTPDDSPSNEWKYKRRGTILGKWHEIKQDLWKLHKSECRRRKAKPNRKKINRLDFKD